jgi:NAD(P)-dependent dehydrogenase (short-subunit alcohol dehydrogenase family)
MLRNAIPADEFGGPGDSHPSEVMSMLLKDKVAVVYGGGGVIGGSVARAFAREGATVYLAGRTRAKLDAVARDIASTGGVAHAAVIDLLEDRQVTDHAQAVAVEAGRIDVAFNAFGVMHVQGTPLLELSLEDYEHPIRAYTRTHFLTSKAVARHMIARRSGVILTLSTQGARIWFPGVLGFGTACAGIEGFTRHLAAELGGHGVRVVCLRSDALPEAVTMGSHSGEVFRPVAERQGMTVEKMLSGPSTSLLGRFPTLANLANAAAFAASDHGGSMTGTTMNLTCGASID